MNDPAEAALARLEASPDRLRIAFAEDVAAPLDHLLSHSDDLERVVLLTRWSENWPGATLQLLSVASSNLAFSVGLAPTLARWLGRYPPAQVIAGIDGVLVKAWPTLQGAWREVAAERPAIQRVYGLVPPPRSEKAPPWPPDQPFPPASTYRGAHARLTSLGYTCGPPTDVPTDALKAAIARFQLFEFLDPNGELDEETEIGIEEDSEERP